jgi:hypothetical protein
VPEAAYREAEMGESVPVARHSKVKEVPTHNGLQSRANFRNRVMRSPSQLDLHLQQHRLHAFANRLPKHQKPSLLRFPADMQFARLIKVHFAADLQNQLVIQSILCILGSA